MDRRTFLVGCASVLATPFVAEAQKPKAAKIGFLLGGTLSTPSVQIETFKQTLHERRWVEVQNLTLEYRPAEGHYERLQALARELVVRGVDVIVTDGTPQTRAAIEVTKTIPIVMATTGDPVASGLVSNLAHPGGNLTGASYFLPQINVKRLELLKEAAPHIARVAVLYNALNAVDERAIVAVEAVAKTLKLRIQRLAIQAPADFDAVFPMLTRQRVDAVTMVEDALIHSYALRVVDVALKGGVPTVVGLSSLVEGGAFMSYGPNRAELWRKAALLTDKILRGAKPGDLPVEQPTKFELVINLRTANTLGLTIHGSLLARADQVIE